MSSSVLREILFISHKYPPSTGGMEKFSYELVQGFEHSDAMVHKLVFTGGESKLWWFISLRRRVRAIFSKHPSIQVVHINDALMAFFCRWIQNEFKVVVIPTFHGLDVVFPLGIYQRKIFPG